jgi:hypothetical protein
MISQIVLWLCGDSCVYQRGIFGIQKVTLCSNEGLTTMAAENGRRSV